MEQLAAECASLLDRHLRKGENGVHTLNEIDITAAEHLVKLLGPVQSAPTIMCEEAQSTVSVTAPLTAELSEHFKISEEDSTLVTEMKQMAVRELEQRGVDVQKVLQRASALDANKEERDETSVSCMRLQSGELYKSNRNANTIYE